MSHHIVPRARGDNDKVMPVSCGHVPVFESNHMKDPQFSWWCRDGIIANIEKACANLCFAFSGLHPVLLALLNLFPKTILTRWQTADSNLLSSCAARWTKQVAAEFCKWRNLRPIKMVHCQVCCQCTHILPIPVETS